MNIPTCSDPQHKGNPLNLVCIERSCQASGLICSYCLLKTHSSHVKYCVPIKDFFKAVNKANNPKIKEDLGHLGSDIIKQHHAIIVEFRTYLKQILEKINSIQSTIEQEMKHLTQVSEIFIGEGLEKSLNVINSDKSSQAQLQEEVKKLVPLIALSETQELVALGKEEKRKEVDRIRKMAEVLERESKYWMDKSLQDLCNVQKSIEKATQKKLVVQKSENRYGLCQEGWTQQHTDAISFQHSKKDEIWLTGLGIYEVIFWPEQPLFYTIALYEGNGVNEKKLLFRDKFKIDKMMSESLDDHIYMLHLTNKAIKLDPNAVYTISITPSQQCITYYGMNGSSSSQDFSYFDTLFDKGQSTNGTVQSMGYFPCFMYEA